MTNDHYYSAAPESAHRYAECAYAYRGETLRFMTDAGVFSRGEVDFGTDTLLRALPDGLSGRVLDLGCGWGAVGVSVGKKYPACEVVMSDVNTRALALAARNAAANGVRAQTVESDGLDSVPGRFDAVLTNPPIRAGKAAIYRLFAQCAQHLAPGGALYIVIRKQQGAQSAITYLRGIFESVETIDKSGGFWVICCRREEEA